MGACCDNDEEYSTATKFYCHTCIIECFRHPKRKEKWDNKPCLACGETLLDKGMWNDITGRRGICALELESVPNPNSDSNNDNDENNGSSSVQNGNNNDNNSNSDSNFNSNYKQYIMLPDFTKKQELKWFSDNDKGIMPKCVHDTDAGFDLRYLEKDLIKLEPHSHTCINLKIALEISATTMVQLASRSSLAKKGINIRRGIIDAEYVGNIIAMLQNDSEKTYSIDPNKKIAQGIFLSLVKITQLVSMGNRKELGITAREIQGFGLMDRIDIPVNMAEEEIVDKREIISTH
ncbi:hypothetical protein G9A89_011021 [Geosiphon pyriformis]|nr:hypothetical protein G9A89_011021 [Geosiphon pyriformis]